MPTAGPTKSRWPPRILADFRKRYPGIAMEFHDTVSDASLDLVRRGTVDFAINARVSSPCEFDTRLLFNEPFYLICSPSHPLAQRKRVALRALAGCDYIHTMRSGSVWHWLDPHIRDIELKDTGFELGHLSTLAGLIANGIGVSIVPGFTLFHFNAWACRRYRSATRACNVRCWWSNVVAIAWRWRRRL